MVFHIKTFSSCPSITCQWFFQLISPVGWGDVCPVTPKFIRTDHITLWLTRLMWTDYNSLSFLLESGPGVGPVLLSGGLYNSERRDFSSQLENCQRFCLYNWKILGFIIRRFLSHAPLCG